MAELDSSVDAGVGARLAGGGRAAQWASVRNSAALRWERVAQARTRLHEAKARQVELASIAQSLKTHVSSTGDMVTSDPADEIAEVEAARLAEAVELADEEVRRAEEASVNAAHESVAPSGKVWSFLRVGLSSVRHDWVLFMPEQELEIRLRNTSLLTISFLLESDVLLKTNNLDWLDQVYGLVVTLSTREVSPIELLTACADILRKILLRYRPRKAVAFLGRDEQGDTLVARISEAIAEIDEELIELKRVDAIRKIELAAAEASSAAASAKKAAGAAGDAALTGHFVTYAKQEYRRSFWYLGGTIVVVCLAILIPVVVAWRSTVGAFGWQEAVRSAISLPLLGLAYYLSRESSIHSESARRAHEIEVRLQTIEAFTETMTDAQAQETRGLLGNMVYGHVEFVSLAPANNLGKETDSLIEVMRSLATSIGETVGKQGSKS